MTPERWQAISRVYHDALAQPEEARDAFIRQACAGNSEVEREVRSLVAQSSRDSSLHAIVARGTTNTTLGRSGKLGRFELRGLLGVGGMGEVYRAHDSSLGRDVAVKVLPPAFVANPDRLARFEREARVLAALSHPHIGAIYGVEEIAPDAGSGAPSTRALVLELVEGETLADHLRRARLGLDEALDIARQIADALEAAHERGIIHRDLKPANIKIRPDGVVKVLDFGLAKADALTGASEATSSQRPPGETSAGMILGTPAYMSPEQARGLPVDKRTDVWAFGCVLYEMLSGRATFAGETVADIVAAVLEREPDWSALPPSTPPALRRLLHRCLERNPNRRLRDLGDARLDLDDNAGASPIATPVSRGRLTWAWVAAAVSVLVAALLAAVWIRPQPPSSRPLQFVVDAPDGHTLVGLMHPSPDARQLLFVASDASGESALWVRPLDSVVAQRLSGTTGASDPFWSADGGSVGFSAGGVLKRIAAAGGPVQRIADLDPHTLGATWGRDNTIVFTPSNRAALFRVAASGGAPTPLTTLNGERQENSHRWPQFLPDGRHILYTARSDVTLHTGIYVASLDDPDSAKRLLDASSAARYISTGHLLFTRDNTLFAQRFDDRALALLGEPVAIVGDLAGEAASASSAFAVSPDGSVLTYHHAGPRRLVWFDRTGQETGTVAARGDFSQLALSPDGSRAAVVMPDPQNGNRDVWVVALATGALTRLTSDPASDWFPVWSPDGRDVLFASDRGPTPAFYRTAVGGGGGDQLVYRADSNVTVFPTDWSRDGTSVVFHSYPRGNVFLLPLAPGARPSTIVDSPYTDWVAALSPDGRSLAYVSDETGEAETYVKALNTSGRQRISISGGVQPRWHRQGRELFFLDPNSTLWAAALDGSVGPIGAPLTALFDGCGDRRAPAVFMYRYDVTADGRRSLWICDGSGRTTATVMVNLEAIRP
jgi:Tol biopolymer transport system component